MTDAIATVVHQSDAKEFWEGPELCREFFRNDQLWFGTSTVKPGDIGAVDPGHANGWEIFYCISGEGIIDDGTREYTLSSGDALAVPPALPHRIHNRSSEPVVMVWAGGPDSLQS